MTNRERVRTCLAHRQPDRVPYHIEFTAKAHARMAAYYGDARFHEKLGNCLTPLSSEPRGSWREVSPDTWEDQFGVRWNRSVDKDIGNVESPPLREPRLAGYQFPDPEDDRCFADIPEKIREQGDLFRVFSIGFSLYERAWTLRGMENPVFAPKT